MVSVQFSLSSYSYTVEPTSAWGATYMYLYGLHPVSAAANCLYPQYVEDWSFDCGQADGMTILHQAVKGLEYLHSIGIGELSKETTHTLTCISACPSLRTNYPYNPVDYRRSGNF